MRWRYKGVCNDVADWGFSRTASHVVRIAQSEIEECKGGDALSGYVSFFRIHSLHCCPFSSCELILQSWQNWPFLTRFRYPKISNSGVSIHRQRLILAPVVPTYLPEMLSSLYRSRLSIAIIHVVVQHCLQDVTVLHGKFEFRLESCNSSFWNRQCIFGRSLILSVLKRLVIWYS